MTNITTKLRSGNYGWMSRDLNAEAADEIDRLRAELAGYVEANRYMKGELDDALEDARKYADAQREVARLKNKINGMLEIISDELPKATRRRVGARFNAELDNKP